MTELQKNTIKYLKEGLAPSQVAKKLNRPISSISSVIKRFNIKDYNTIYKDKVNHTYFDKIDNEIKSYLLGFFLADGWISKNRFGITIQSRDDYILNYFEKFSNSKIYKRNRTTSSIKRRDSSTIRWTSSYMVNTFKNYHITTNKTYNTNFKFPFNKIENAYIRDFIRGFIDGDGSFESNKGVFTITIVNTSYNFLKQLGNIVSNIYNGITYRITEKEGKAVTYFILRYSFFSENKPEKVLQIYNYLYSDSTIFLTRKKNKIESYLKYRGKL